MNSFNQIPFCTSKLKISGGHCSAFKNLQITSSKNVLNLYAYLGIANKEIMSFTFMASSENSNIQMVDISFWKGLAFPFEKFMKVHLVRNIRDKFAQCFGLGKERRKEGRPWTFSSGFTLSSVDNSCAWGFNFLFIYVLFTTYYTEPSKVVNASN